VAIYYVDASALVKLYVTERGTSRVKTLVASGGITTSLLSVAEVASALGRRTLAGEYSAEQRDELFLTFLNDARAYDVMTIAEPLVMAAARRLLEGGGVPILRGSDAIHLATAEQSFILARQAGEDGVLVTSDRRLRDAAMAAGLTVENPEEHE